MLKGFGIFLLLAGLFGIGSNYVFANGMSQADVVRLANNRALLSLLPVWFYGSIAATIAGFIMWMVGIIVQTIQQSTSDGWQKRRIAGRNVEYRKSRDGTHEVTIDGDKRSFETYDQLTDYLRIRQ